MDPYCEKKYLCRTEYVFENVCKLYIKAKADIDCFIPCEVTNCSTRYDFDILCPLSICDLSWTPLNPAIPFTNHWYAISIATIIIALVIVVGALTTIFVRKRRLNRQSEEPIAMSAIRESLSRSRDYDTMSNSSQSSQRPTGFFNFNRRNNPAPNPIIRSTARSMWMASSENSGKQSASYFFIE